MPLLLGKRFSFPSWRNRLFFPLIVAGSGKKCFVSSLRSSSVSVFVSHNCRSSKTTSWFLPCGDLTQTSGHSVSGNSNSYLVVVGPMAKRRSAHNSANHDEKKEIVGAVEAESGSRGGNKRRTVNKTKVSAMAISTVQTATIKQSENEEKEAAVKGKRSKKEEPQSLTVRDVLPKLWDEKSAMSKFGSYTCKIMSWNVAGLRALLKNHPSALSDLAKANNLDVICLQETKLQAMHADDPKLKIKGFLLEQEGYDAYFNFATAKKGYSGTAVFVKRRHHTSATTPAVMRSENNKSGVNGAVGIEKVKQLKQATLGHFIKEASAPEKNREASTTTKNSSSDSFVEDVNVTNLIPLKVSYDMGKSEHDAEGRIITLDFPLFSISNLYVPNSGQNLNRLLYRTQLWDVDLLQTMQQKEQERQCPVIWLGDLNVAHTYMDAWNDGAKHLLKQAGTTIEEKESFSRQLDAGYVDAFRHLHPTALGQYTYWSQRAGNRGPNKGLRLDYFVCSRDLMDDDDITTDDTSSTKDKKMKKKMAIVRDSYMIQDQFGSDHCPIILEIEIRKQPF